jgi:hypothetical protein
MYIRIIDTILTFYIVVMMISMIIIMIKNKDTLRPIFYLIWIPFIGFIQLLHTQLIVYFIPDKHNFITDIIVVSYMTTEYLCLLYYLLSNLDIPKINSILFSLIIPLIFIIGTISNRDFIEKNSFTYVLAETISLIICSLFLLSKITLDDNIKIIQKNPEFLVCTSIFFMFTYFLPFYAIRNTLLQDIELYIKVQTLVIVFGYGIFYTLIIYALKWKINQSKS